MIGATIEIKHNKIPMLMEIIDMHHGMKKKCLKNQIWL